MKMLTIAATAALLMLGTAAQAQRVNTPNSPLYGEIGITSLKIKADGGYSSSPTALRGIVGYDLHPLVAVEGMLAFGLSGDDGTFNDGTGPVNVDAKLKHAYGVFVKPKFSPTNNVELFGRLGWVKSKVRFDEPGFSDTVSDSGAAFGVGVNYRFNPRMHVGLDYMRYNKVEEVKVHGLTVSFGYRF